MSSIFSEALVEHLVDNHRDIFYLRFWDKIFQFFKKVEASSMGGRSKQNKFSAESKVKS